MSARAPEKDPRDESSGIFNGTTIGITMLIVAFVASLVVAVRNTLRIERPAKPVIYIAHWQLEKGYREALDAIIKDYNELHPEVEVKQMGVTERVFSQWINTQLIAGTAPDICEMGHSKVLTQDEYTVKYFVPLSTYLTEPNPYNKGTDIEHLPWKETMLDGMKGGFREGLQEYFGIPTSLTSMRLFYNKRLVSNAVKMWNEANPNDPIADGPPKSFGHWMKQCDAIKAYANKVDDRILPIVSCYSIAGMQGKLEVPFTSYLADELDLDLDGQVTTIETYIGYLQKKVSLDTPAVKAMFETVKCVGDNMQSGFSAMDRQQAQYYFVNELAGYLWTGSWDANGTAVQAEAKGFEVGVFDFPLPAPDEPGGQYIRGRQNESMNGAGTYGIFKGSKHQKEAMDFLKYISAQKPNEKLNQISQWPPLTIGAKPSKLMEPFAADMRGFNTRLNFSIGSRVQTEINGKLINYYQGDDTFETLKKAFDKIIVDPARGGDWGWWFEFDKARSDSRNKERTLAQQQLLERIRPEDFDEKRYRRALFQQVYRNNAAEHQYLFKLYRGKEMPEF